MPTSYTIVLAATFTAQPLAETLDFWTQELASEAAVVFAPYHQIFQQLLDADSLFAQNRNGVNALLFRFEDWHRDAERPGVLAASPARLRQTMQELGDALKAAAQRLTVPLLVCLCPSAPNLQADAANAALFAELEQNLAAQLAVEPGLHLLTPAELQAQYPIADAYDAQGEKSGHIPYTPAGFAALGTLLARKINALRQPPYKVVVLDCDGTLWNGVCGEVGAEGIEISAPYRALQAFMQARQEGGTLLCLCSHNIEANVWAVFDTRADMILKRQHITAARINWLPKSDNLKSLATELGLGLDSFVFLDDSPIQCAEVRANCPEVLVLQVPQEVETLPALLRNHWAFDRLRVTEEDRRRTDLYRQQTAREAFRRETGAFADFLAGLELVVEIAPVLPEQVERVAQLSQRTNQFNMTTTRCTAAEIRQQWGTDTRNCLTVTVRDRFGDYGLVGALWTEMCGESLIVRNMLLSCRALGRGVEHRMLAHLGAFAQERGLSRIEIAFAPTARNRPAQAFLDSLVGAKRVGEEASMRYILTADEAAEARYCPGSGEIFANEDSEGEETSVSTQTLRANVQARAERLNRIAAQYVDVEAIVKAVTAKRSRPRPELANGFVAPHEGVESALAALWSEILGVQQIGANDDFFALGGDSLKGTVLINRIQQALQDVLYIPALFDAPTVALLAAYLEARYPQAKAALCGEELPTHACVHANEPLRRVDAAMVAQFRERIPPLPPSNRPQPSKNPTAVFVLSPPRSGSTLLRVMLAGHPLLFSPPELELLSFNTLRERRDAFTGRNTFWLEGTMRAIMELRGCEAEAARGMMEAFEQADLTTPEFYAQMQGWLGDRWLVDKTPAYALDIEILKRAEEDFENALYIHLLRHPGGVVHSFEEARLDQVFFRHPHPYGSRELAELIWIVSQQNILAFLETVPACRQCTLRFEDMVAQPDAAMQSLCDFLHLGYDAGMTQPYAAQNGTRMTDGLHPMSRMLGDFKFHRHSTIDPKTADRWRENLDETILGEVTWQLAEQLGYARLSPPTASLDAHAVVGQMSDAEMDALLQSLLR